MKTKFLAVILVSLLVVSLCIEVILAKEDKDKLERIDVIHYAKPGNPGKAKTPTCYKFLGVKWINLPVNYVINPSNVINPINPKQQNLSEHFVTSAISTSAETWDAATSKNLFSNVYAVNSTLWYGTQDFKNVISFGNYPQENVIAVTSYWRNPRTKAIVEFDIMFDTDWIWGDASTGAWVVDLQNIATHELGHGIGLADIYSTTCSDVTMYGYSGYGDIDGRTLEQPDITGLQTLYGI